MSTTPATTTLQKTVLKHAKDNPTDKPREIAKALDYDIDRGYVKNILDNFHLPGDNDKPASESARRIDEEDNWETFYLDPDDILGGVDYWGCELCDYTSDEMANVSKHISARSDKAHENRTSDEGHLIRAHGVMATPLNRINTEYSEAKCTEHKFRALVEKYQYPEKSKPDVAEVIDSSVNPISDFFTNLGVQWSGAADKAKEVLNNCKIKVGEPTYETKVGNRSYEGPSIDASTQDIGDRPVKEVNVDIDEEVEESTDKDESVFEIELERDELLNVIRESNESIAKSVLDQVLDND